jgi:S1-C subfamily serine protease
MFGEVLMIRRALVLLLFGSALGLVFATLLVPPPAKGGEVPKELRSEPATPTVKAADLSRPFIEATRRVRPAVVRIQNLQRDWRGNLREISGGSGFIISKEGHILTNRHVVLRALHLIVHLPDGKKVTNVVKLGEDARSDVAILQMKGIDNPPVAMMGDSDRLEVGEWVIAIGAPFELESSVSAGIVSATGRTALFGRPDSDTTEDFIQTDAALNPGNSGGPLINLDGQVVAINTAIASPTSRTYAGVGFAIPINLARTVAISLLESGVAKRGYLGVRTQAITQRELTDRGIDARGALEIVHVENGTAAERADFKVGDLLLEANGRPLLGLSTLRAELAAEGPGARVRFKLQRGGRVHNITVVLDEEPVYTFGIEAKALDKETRRSAGVPSEQRGIVITRVRKDSPALRDPKNPLLYPGDVVVALEAGRQRVWLTGPDDFYTTMIDWKAFIARGVPVGFIIEAKGRRYRVSLTRPER